MATNSSVHTLAAGAFFGDSCRSAATPSFQFSELQATVPERQVPLHTHETPHFILITSGVYVTEARNQQGLCSSGTLVFNPAGTTHRDCFRSRKGKFLSISPGAGISRLLGRGSPVPLIMAGEGIRMLDDPLIGERIVSELRMGLEPATMILEGFGLELIGLVAAIEDRTASRMAPRWLLLAKERLEDCFGDDLSIADLATSVRVHPVYLARAYRRYFGCSPGEYLRRCRLLRVQGLLSGTDLPLVQIALQCGFSDQSQMTRSFSSTFGVPPARYRAMRRL
jgi:AraC family transcriptional regulator